MKANLVQHAAFCHGIVYACNDTRRSAPSARLLNAVRHLEKKLTERFFDVGRAGGNTTGSPLRAEWEFLRDIVATFENPEILR